MSIPGLSLPELTLRMLVSLALGLLVGLQRAHAGKEAGMRTHAMVSLGATLMTLVSAYAFRGSSSSPDPTRIAAQIVTGIGFIGGGTILKDGNTIRGLTTAASLWAVAGMGMAVGAGLYTMALIATAAALVTLTLLGRIELRVRLPMTHIWEVQMALSDPGSLAAIVSFMSGECERVHLTSYNTATETPTATLVLTVPGEVRVVSLTERLQSLGAHAVSWSTSPLAEITL